MFKRASSKTPLEDLLEKTKRLHGSTKQFVKVMIKQQIERKIDQMLDAMETIIEDLKRTDLNHHPLFLALTMQENLQIAKRSGVELHDLDKFLSYMFILQNRLQGEVDPSLCEDEIDGM